MNPTQKAVAGGVAVVVLLLLVVVLVTRGSDSSSDAASGPDGTTTSSASTTSSPVAGAEGDSTTTVPSTAGGDPETATPGIVDEMTPKTNLPLDVSLDRESDLHDGETVTVHVLATDGSQIFGADARLCRGDATIENTADYAPTQGGQCVAQPLSAGSDSFVEVMGQEPYASLDLAFRVGVGTDSYQMQDGTPVTIACGPQHPCTLVVRLQVPNGFGFEQFPLTYG